MQTIDDFSDDVITKAIAPEPSDPFGLWYAVADPGFLVSTGLDFSRSAKTRDEAVATCADWVRQSAAGLLKSRPSFLDQNSYDFKYRILPHWEIKARVQDAGLDTHSFMGSIEQTLREEPNRWTLRGHHLSVYSHSRFLESRFQVEILTVAQQVEQGEDIDAAIAEMIETIRSQWAEEYHTAHATDETWETMSEISHGILPTLLVHKSEKVLFEQ